MPNAGLLGLAIVLTLAASVGLNVYESQSVRRGWRTREFRRPGAVALAVGFSVALIVSGSVLENAYVAVAAAVAAATEFSLLRRGGRVASFVILWASAALVVVALDAVVPALGHRLADVALTSLLLACFCGLLRELDVRGSIGWVAGVVAAAAVTALCVLVDRRDEAALGLLVVGAVFAVIAAAPFGSGMLGRMGARLVGLVLGALATRAAVGSPVAMAIVATIGALCVVGYIATLERGYRGRVALVAVGVAIAWGAVGVPAALTMRDVASPLSDAVAKSRRLLRATPQGGLEAASAELVSLERTFRSSSDRLDSGAVRVGTFVPLIGANLRAATDAADVAADLTTSARKLVDQISARSVTVRNAAVDRGALDAFAGGLRSVQAEVARARAGFGDDRAVELLIPELRSGIENLERQLGVVAHRIATLEDGTEAATRLLGFDRPRRYFVAVQNSAESRATGGYIANYGVLVADGGRITLPEFRRTSEFDAASSRPRVLRAPRDYSRRYSRFDVDREWTNVNMSPDFPTVAKVMADQYAQFSGTEVDGVLAVDPVALSQLMRLSGPIRVPGWPVPITWSNVVRITLHDEYIAFDERIDERIDFIGRVAKTVFDRLTNGGLTDLVRAGRVLHNATAGRHIQFWTSDESAAFLRATQSDGSVPPVRGDAVLVTTQNVAGNKTDYFLHRSLTYSAKVRRTRDGIAVDAVLTVKLRNDAPAAGEPRYVIGPYDARFEPGENRTYLTIYSPLDAASATVDGQPLRLDASPELGRMARSAFVSIPAQGVSTIEVHLTGVLRQVERYVLDLGRQPLVSDDEVRLRIDGAGEGGTFRSNRKLKHDLHLSLEVRKK